MTAKQSPALAAIRERYHNCAAMSCHDTASGFSRYCHRHRMQFYRSGDPGGRVLRWRRDLCEFRKMAEEALARNREHPGLIKAVQWFEDLLEWAQHHEGGGWRADLAKNLRRLRTDGATGNMMLTRVVAVSFYGEWNRRTWDDDVCHTVNLGHHALHATPHPPRYSRKTGKPYHLDIKRTTKTEFGRMIREALGVLLVNLWEAAEANRTREARAAQAIKDAVKERPLE